MELVVFLIVVYAATRAWKDSKAAYRKSKDAYTLSAEKRFPDAPESKRAALALRHDAGYWASQLGAGFPATRHGFAAGWHRGRTAQTSARTALEEARTQRLENQADHAEALSGFRERRQEAVRRWRAAVDSDAGRTTEGTVDGEGTPESIRVSSGEWPQPRPGRSPWRRAQTDGRGPGEGSAGSREGSPERPVRRPGETGAEFGQRLLDHNAEQQHAEDLAAEEAHSTSGCSYSWGAAGQPGQWPADTEAEARRRAEYSSTAGTAYTVTSYPPGDPVPGTTAATYLGGEEIQPSEEQLNQWDAEADAVRRRYSTGWTGRPAPEEDPALSDEYLAEVDSIRDSFEFENCESCGGDWGEHEIAPDAFGHAHAICHPHEAGSGSEADQRESPAAAQAAPSTQGEQHMASDVTYDSVLRNMTAAKNVAENETAERLEAARNASATSEEMQALGVDPATLSAMADHLDAHDAAVKALQRVQETAETVEVTMKRGHAGLAEAHANAPVTAAERPFYEG
jgi:hypothetical protein